ncbi:MAG: nicotinate-nucleotide--dimethylbenzimidazole phosphoribosyltransferase [Dissulfurimicrobium sp.]|uniref:nicotinate-nucleotide--dimethylbenzimidazole phosphoribosyltransferase n=1 Tax=Dissulfurimicrobium sp. TaxID=2022436 RepID=UPI004048EEFD
METRFKELVDSIRPINNDLKAAIQAHLDNLTKPRGSLGRLEELAKTYCLIRHEMKPALPKKEIFIFAADHGVTEEGVSAFPKEVTFQMVYNFLSGGAAINVLARHVGASVKVVDIGVDHDFAELDGLIRRKVMRGSKNMAKTPAMGRAEAINAIMIGASLAKEAAANGITLLATGEMGIGNTTPASAVTSIFCNMEPEEVTDRGTGIGSDVLRHKVSVIKQALSLHKPNKSDPVGVLAKVGGLEIAGICGLVLGAASAGVPVVTDGFISTAGALTAFAIQPLVRDYLIASHQSVEKGHRAQLEQMGLRPVLDLDLRLGEGTGAALAMGLIDAALKIYLEMATFSDAKISTGSEV